MSEQRNDNETPEVNNNQPTPPSDPGAVNGSDPGDNETSNHDGGDAGYAERLERLGGEPAPVITPEEFARLQQAGQVHIDSQGRVRATRRSDAEAGVSLRKRRAWYGA
ncbi:MAG: hypothetical protein GYB67_13945 [Chloroflexi bacterium]|nr:hypothetical protein [Chloroflexota bacterium]